MKNFFQPYEKIAVFGNGETLTGTRFAEIQKQIEGIVLPRSLVVILCKNSAGCLASYASLINIKAVPIMLDGAMAKELSESIITNYRPNFIFKPTADVIKGEKVLAEFFDYSLIKNSDAKIKMHDDLALMLTTSGSTGSPKFVRQTYKNIEANARAIIQYLGIKASDRPITTLPMNYTYGLSIIHSHLLAGTTILLTEYTFFQREFWQFFKEQNATTFGGVPYNYECLKKLRFFSMDLPSIKYLTQAGGKLTYELTKEYVEHCQKKNIDFIVMYGQTEATARMSYLPKDKALEKCGSIGIAIPNGRFELIDDMGKVIKEANVDGELVYYGDNVTMGYAESVEDLTKGDEWKGKLVTGDMARRDADGYLYITGRKKRFIKVFGSRVNLDECERLLKGNSIVDDCASAGTDDNLLIYITDASKVECVKTFFAERTDINTHALKVKVIDAIPKNEAGKTVYAKLPN